MFKLWALALSAAAVLCASGAAAQAVDTGHLQAELVAQKAFAPPGGVVHVALRQKIDRGWHTYWRNPGDAGAETQIAWTLPAGWKAGPILWAKPQRLPLKTLMDYGYTGEVLLPVAITVPASAKPGQTVTVKAAVSFLVCEQICVPEDAVLTLPIKVAAGSPGAAQPWGAAVDRALAAAPKPAGLKAVFSRQGGAVKIAITGGPVAGGNFPGAYFYPYAGTVIEHAKPQRIEKGPQGMTLTLSPGYDFTKGKPPAQISGVLDLGAKAYEITARPGALPAGARGGGSVAGADLGLGGPKAPQPGGGGPGGLPLALAFAFLGGVILNLMPCVFPVLSMKAAALTGHAHAPGKARAHGLAFTAGVVAAFLALAGALIAAQAAGSSAGWGFQLQSPAVVGALGLLMLLIALNLSGVFEVGASVQGVGGSLAGKGGLTGSAFTGALAVVVAAPCTAPFMAGALGYALTQPAPMALSVFFALGLGFAAPFLALAFIPGLLGRLPRPGPWMDTLRRLLAFPMYAAAAWLAWVFALQTGDTALALLLAAAVAVSLGAWLYGRGQTAPRAPRLWTGLGGIAAAAAVALLVAGVRPAPEAAALVAEPFSPERLDALRGEGRPVLVNFTAAWCVTCQVNEGVALSTRPVAEAFARTGAVYLKGDWTKRDPVIGEVLAQHGRAGVPLYLVYGTGGREAVVLPQLLTQGQVVGALEAAAKPAA